MLFRIDIYDVATGKYLGYLRLIDNELSLMNPSKGGSVKIKKPPHYVENDIEAKAIFTKFLEDRSGGRSLRELTYRLVN
jgi:hypothetical protein